MSYPLHLRLEPHDDLRLAEILRHFCPVVPDALERIVAGPPRRHEVDDVPRPRPPGSQRT